MSLFDCAQIVFLALSISLSLGNTWRLKRRKVSVWVLARQGTASSHRALEAFYLVGLVAWILLILMLATDRADPLPVFLRHPLLDGTVWKVLALPLLALSLALHALGLRALGPNWRVGTSGDHPGELVTNGVYAFSRNPILLAMILYALAVWLTYSNLLLLGILCTVVFLVHVQIRREETFLAEQHGARYAAYCRQVGRYITLLRTS